MAKVKLGARPKSFKKIVNFDMLDGSKGAITCEFKYRTRKEFGKFIDEVIEAAKVDPTEGDEGETKTFSMHSLMEKTSGSNAAYVLKVLDSWSLDEDLTLENIEQLADEIPAAVAAIMETYRTACTEGRLGN